MRNLQTWHACTGCAQQSWLNGMPYFGSSLLAWQKAVPRKAAQAGSGAAKRHRREPLRPHKGIGREPFLETNSDLGNLLVDHLETSVNLLFNVYRSVRWRQRVRLVRVVHWLKCGIVI